MSAGLHETYFGIIQTFSGFENELGFQILSDELWSNIVWGLSTMSLGLKSCAFLKSDFELTYKSDVQEDKDL